jgi:hypothetical protein
MSSGRRIQEYMRHFKINDLMFKTRTNEYLETEYQIYHKRDIVYDSTNQYAVEAFLKGYVLGRENG